jgi:oxygen-independent coproporphyrinogen-3 oxidase
MLQNNFINPLAIPAALIDKYSRNGPRYTSYPTAPHFKVLEDHLFLQQHWQQQPAGSGLSVYVHIPFCRQRCLYCGCHTETGHRQQFKNSYVKTIQQEIAFFKDFLPKAGEVSQIAFGGGTPTNLSLFAITSICNQLKNSFRIARDAEQSIEIDPRFINQEYLRQLTVLGFNRFSFGVQDLDPAVQTIINRQLKEAVLEKSLLFLKSLGINAINIDLIYGLPGQTPSSFFMTIKKIIQLRPSRIALFGYAHVPWVSRHQRLLEKYSIPGSKERIALLGTALEELTLAGYQHIGMDHFAIPGDELLKALHQRSLTRNFMGYSTRRDLDMIGIGASAISYVHHSYAQNQKAAATYTKPGKFPKWEKGIVLNADDQIRRQLIIDLFCNFYLEKSKLPLPDTFDHYFQIELENLKDMAQDGLLKLNPDSIEVTPLGRFFIRNICMEFDRYLNPTTANTTYSRIL